MSFQFGEMAQNVSLNHSWHAITYTNRITNNISDIFVFPAKVEKIGPFQLPNSSKRVHPRNVIFVYKICGELQETKQ